MKALRSDLVGSMNILRNPLYHTYQKTLPFPPKTTIVGLINNAMGGNIEDHCKLLKELKVSVVINKIAGVVSDVWRYRKIKTWEIESDICVREFLFKPEFTIYVVGEHLEKMRGCLTNPKRILYLGRDDNLVLLKNVESVNLRKKKSARIDSVVDFDFTTKPHKINVKEGEEMIKPTVVSLPLEFRPEEERRIPTKKMAFSFWYGVDVIFTEGIECFTDGKYFIRLF